MKVILEMLFLTLRNANISFVKKKLTRRFYIIQEALPSTKKVELIEKKRFVKVALNQNDDACIYILPHLP